MGNLNIAQRARHSRAPTAPSLADEVDLGAFTSGFGNKADMRNR
jgi:hypothetical protein